MSLTTAAVISACSAGASTPFSHDHRRRRALFCHGLLHFSIKSRRNPPPVQPPLVLYKSPEVAISYGAAAGLISGISKLRIRESYVLRKQSELVLWLSRLLRIGIKDGFIALVLLPLWELTVGALETSGRYRYSD
ncbi:hypothetical protein PIB30_025779 [Stylosanthes scabra]|uniref:Uncharacterized protein n=1 Tax=Stylosanthes scabra TaxID=79078 RepID=A0ABU6SAM5_9FABA|nr:hypothetical protein [Stylosanthes scabra]